MLTSLSHLCAPLFSLFQAFYTIPAEIILILRDVFPVLYRALKNSAYLSNLFGLQIYAQNYS